jgi:hypothetical protein
VAGAAFDRAARAAPIARGQRRQENVNAKFGVGLNSSPITGGNMTWQSDKWPINKTIGFLIFTSAGLWFALGLTLKAIIR